MIFNLHYQLSFSLNVSLVPNSWFPFCGYNCLKPVLGSGVVYLNAPPQLRVPTGCPGLAAGFCCIVEGQNCEKAILEGENGGSID